MDSEIALFDVDIVSVLCDFFCEISLELLEFPQRFLQTSSVPPTHLLSVLASLLLSGGR